MIEVNLQTPTAVTELPHLNQFETWVNAVMEDQANVEVSIRIVDENESASLNEQWRNKKGPTNILSFLVIEPSEQDPLLVGDMVICAPLVNQEANEQNIDITEYWAHLTVHGCYHLLGYDHNTASEAQIMEKLETQILLDLGYNDPYGEHIND